MHPLRVLVVDDTALYRKIIRDILAELPDVEVVGSANNGRMALARIAQFKPDLITLDIEMPEMNGIEVLEALKGQSEDPGVIMLSTLTHEGSRMTIKALELGAFDFIPKPVSGTLEENRLFIKNALAPMLKAFGRQREIKTILRSGSRPELKAPVAPPPEAPPPRPAARPPVLRPRCEAIGIAISTGGPNALSLMMPMLPADLGVPILIVQHMPPLFTQSLANSLNAKCRLQVKEAENGEPILPGIAYIAPGGRQMKLLQAGADLKKCIQITDDPPLNSCRPSADYLFRSMADIFGSHATGVIMTGMGTDGNAGLKLMKARGAFIIAQDEASCTVFGMPKEPIDSGTADAVVPLQEMAQEIARTVKRFTPT